MSIVFVIGSVVHFELVRRRGVQKTETLLFFLSLENILNYDVK